MLCTTEVVFTLLVLLLHVIHSILGYLGRIFAQRSWFLGSRTNGGFYRFGTRADRRARFSPTWQNPPSAPHQLRRLRFRFLHLFRFVRPKYFPLQLIDLRL